MLVTIYDSYPHMKFDVVCPQSFWKHTNWLKLNALKGYTLNNLAQQKAKKPFET